MKTRLLSALLVFLFITLAIPAVSAEPVTAVGAGSGIVLDIAKEILNPYIKDIPLILQKNSIEVLEKNREKALSDLCYYRSNLANITERCEENHRAILQEFKNFLDKRKGMKIGDHPLVKGLGKKVFEKKINDNNNNYKLVLAAISERERQIEKLDGLIKERKEIYRIATGNAMSGHEIMERVRALENESHQLKKENQQLKKENDKLRDVVKLLIQDNTTLLSMLNE